MTQNTKENTSLEERKEAELVVIKLVQAKAFSKERKGLKARVAVAKTKDSNLYKLSPFLDEEGILRVGARLSHAVLHPHVNVAVQSHLTSSNVSNVGRTGGELSTKNGRSTSRQDRSDSIFHLCQIGLLWTTLC